MILHFLTLPFKVLIISIIYIYHKIRIAFKYSHTFYGRRPNADIVIASYKAVILSLREHLEGDQVFPLYKTNPDHQPLRQGSLAWSTRRMDIVNGMNNYIQHGKFIRGPQSQYDAPAAMPMSVAHAIATALKIKKDINLTFKYDYIQAVDNLIKDGMKIDKDVSTKCRLGSTGFDAIYALSLLYTAHALTNDNKYTKEANKILFLKGYALLLLAPIVFISDKKRNYFIDHISIFGLRTAYLTCPNKIVKALLKHSIKYVYSLSKVFKNPYFAALAHECGALSEKECNKVLDLHCRADVLRACKERAVAYTNKYPSDFSTHSADEFLFDDIKPEGIDLGLAENKKVPLNGLCLGRSIAILMDREI